MYITDSRYLINNCYGFINKNSSMKTIKKIKIKIIKKNVLLKGCFKISLNGLSEYINSNYVPPNKT